MEASIRTCTKTPFSLRERRGRSASKVRLMHPRDPVQLSLRFRDQRFRQRRRAILLPFAVMHIQPNPLGRLEKAWGWLHAIVLSALWSDGAGDGSGTMIRIHDPWPPNVGSIYGRFYLHGGYRSATAWRRRALPRAVTVSRAGGSLRVFPDQQFLGAVFDHLGA